MSVNGTIHHYECGWIFHVIPHKCPSCGSGLKKYEEQFIVNSKSEEAKKYNFWCGDLLITGDVLVIEYSFYCPRCKITFSPKTIKDIEKKRLFHWGKSDS